MNIPKNLLYTKTHEWIDFKDDNSALVGITDFAQSQLGETVCVNLPTEGEEFAAGDVVANIETAEATSDVFLPVTGSISAVNSLLESRPDLINTAPYDAWICEVSAVEDRLDLLDARTYDEFLKFECE